LLKLHAGAASIELLFMKPMAAAAHPWRKSRV
jgi:hypothetical protein